VRNGISETASPLDGSEKSWIQIMALPRAARRLILLPLAIVLALVAADLARAWGVKHVLSNAAQEAARVTVSTPLTSRTCPEPVPYVPCSIQMAAGAAKQYLANAGFDRASCIAPKTPSFSGVLVWVFSCDGSTACDSTSGSICLKIDMTDLEVGSNKTLISNTRVRLQYPHAWTLRFVTKTLPGGPTLGLPRTLSASAVERN